MVLLCLLVIELFEPLGRNVGSWAMLKLVPQSEKVAVLCCM